MDFSLDLNQLIGLCNVCNDRLLLELNITFQAWIVLCR